MNATATKTAAKPANDKIEDAKPSEPAKTAAELKQEQANIIQSLADLKDVSKMEELMASLKAVKEQIADIEKERTASLNEVSKSILIHNIKFSELTEEARQMLGAVVASRAVSAPVTSEGSEEKRERKANELHPFGFIPFKDFGFTPTSHKIGKDGKDWTKETGLNWVLGKVYGPTNPTAFMDKVREKVQKDGIAIMDKYMSEDFKKWVNEGREGQGPAKGRTIYKNRTTFYKFFGLDKDGKPAK